MAVRTLKDWISGAELDRILAISWKSRPRVVALNAIRTRTVPGTLTRYSRADVERVATQALEVAGRQAS